jgi:hypothetical protein
MSDPSEIFYETGGPPSRAVSFVSVTRLRVRSWRYLPAFMIQALRSAYQAKRDAGSIAVSIMQEARNTFWTRTVWESEGAMRAFMLSGVHSRAMPRLLEWCDEASVVHWLQASPDLPLWDEAHRRMQQEGRWTKVNHPSAAQLAKIIPAPDPRSMRELRLKAA